jgi:hypothetical protein
MSAISNRESKQAGLWRISPSAWTSILILGLLLAYIFIHPRQVCAQETPSDYRVKAAYVLNFLSFIQWPEDAFSDTKAPVVIGIVGEDPFGNQLPQAILGKTVQGHNLVIRRYKAGEDLRGSHILFISASEKKRLSQILAGLRGSSVLTIAEMDRFLEAGGAIQFTFENSQIRFAINADAAGRARLKVSSKLLSVAQYVQASGAPGKN